MRCNAVVEEPRPPVPESGYEGAPVRIREIDCCYGARVLIDFALSGEGELDGHVVSGIADKELNEDTKLGRWVAAISGRMPEEGEEVIADDLLHRECRLLIRHGTHALGQVFATVVDVRPSTIRRSPTATS